MGEERISRAHADELAAWFAAEAAGLFGYACLLARGDRALAVDLVQAAFESVARAWGILRCMADGQRRGWLRTTAANIAVTGFRREAAFRDRLPRIEARYREIPVDPLEQVFSTITLERCWQVIRDLPEQQHAVALLRWGLDMKEREIAAVLDMAEKTVSVHLHRARRQLIAQLGPDYPFSSSDAEGRSA